MAVGITETALRDAHQSLLATRLKTKDMLPIADRLDAVGYHSLEMWGGATFDTCLRFLKEDPWERLRTLRKAMPKTKFQMLLRGQNVVGYKHYPDDIVEAFVERAASNGIDIFRIFDALNDVRNIAVAAKAAKRAGAHVQGALCYTRSPVHDLKHFLKVSEELIALDVDSLCIKDMAGLISPYEAYDLVKAMKRTFSVPVQLHSHYTSGMASAAYLKVIEAGADVVDCAISSVALATSQPPTESIVASLQGTKYDTGLDQKLLKEIAEYFAGVRKRYKLYESEFLGVDTNVLAFQIPGGMYSNLVSQLKEQKALDKMPLVLEEVPKVRKELGYPPLVTPTSQIVGTQAVLNVITGSRYKIIPKEVKDYVKGLYGRPPGPIDPEVQRLAIGDEIPTTKRPGDTISPGLEGARREARQERLEDVLSYALFPQVAAKFFAIRSDPDWMDKAMAAVAAVAVAQEKRNQKTQVVEVEPTGKQSPWRIAARTDLMASRYRGGFA